MPQMAPMWWYTLFLIFILTYYIFMMLMYFYNVYSNKSDKKTSKLMIKNMNWKW
uniref:ATP synthase complex subunit 8 n=1 Tax=Roburocoris exiguus TaxID=2127001 RepID=A0A514LNB3_9HEMI|nr:ATP synthase F0 subunit 8 [Roburocoris exiguus]